MFSNHQNPAIAQIRRELRGQLPDTWIDEVVLIAEFQLSYQTIDELHTEDLLKLKVAAAYSQTLKQGLGQMTGRVRSADVEVEPLPKVQKLFGSTFNW